MQSQSTPTCVGSRATFPLQVFGQLGGWDAVEALGEPTQRSVGFGDRLTEVFANGRELGQRTARNLAGRLARGQQVADAVAEALEPVLGERRPSAAIERHQRRA